jgi:2-keto-4-pentenoate hydratase/2-oxohepta-3-ene-1,7-dioic acid hydratase in catechol pathway
MQLMRVRHETGTLLARREGGKLAVLARESEHPAADVLREALAGQVDLAGGTVVVAEHEVTALAPVGSPSKVIAVGLNYPQHVAEAQEQRPAAPVLFAKFPSAIIGPGEPIRPPAQGPGQVDYEAEVGIVIGRAARDVAERDALGHVLGVVPCNDISARDVQFADGQWIRGKSFDTFLPVGPAIVTLDELPAGLDLAIRCILNGSVMQDGRTGQMIFSIPFLVSYISRCCTLLPGDLILTGTPSGAGFARTPPVYLRDGDIVEVSLEGVGTLRNPVKTS